MGISYREFSNKTDIEKIIFMEDFTQEQLEKFLNRDLTRFFSEILYNEENNYLKMISLETLIFLTMIKKIRANSTLEILLDMGGDDHPLIITSMLKYLTVLYNEDKYIIEKLESYRDHENTDISSEAYYRLGLISFFNTNHINNAIDFHTLLDKSSQLFCYSYEQIENRTDAEYFYYVTVFLKAFLAEDKERLDSAFKKLSSIALYRQAFYYDQKLIELEYKISKILLNLLNIYNSVVEQQRWTDFYKEFKRLSQYHFEFLSVSLSKNEHQQRLITTFKDVINKEILEKIYLKNLNYHILRIDTIINDHKSDKELTEFLQYVKQIINNRDDGKKKDDNTILNMCFKIKEVFPEVDIMDTLNRLRKYKDENDLENLISIVLEYAKNKEEINREFITGFPTGQEIFNEIQQSIRLALPSYQEKKMKIFMRIMEEIIQYLLLTITHKRSEEFNFLYTKKHKGKGNTASEGDLQESLFKHFRRSRIAYGVNEEIKDFSDGGRVDIVFKVDNHTFPIELKKTAQKISKQKIQDKYLEQLHSYTYAYDQLGVFVLLDLNEKDSPVNDVRELVYLDHLKPQYNLDGKYPDYIVVVIVPGNKPLPSDKSIYR